MRAVVVMRATLGVTVGRGETTRFKPAKILRRGGASSRASGIVEFYSDLDQTFHHRKPDNQPRHRCQGAHQLRVRFHRLALRLRWRRSCWNYLGDELQHFALPWGELFQRRFFPSRCDADNYQ